MQDGVCSAVRRHAPREEEQRIRAGGRVVSGSAANPAGGAAYALLLEYNGLGALQRAEQVAEGITSEEYRTDALGSQIWIRDLDMVDGINRTRMQTVQTATGQITGMDLATPGSGTCVPFNESCHPI
jgi:hypothetical protein